MLCNVHKQEFVTFLKKLLRYYSERHAQKMCELKQCLITQFIGPSPHPSIADSELHFSNSQEPKPSASQETMGFFDEDVVSDIDFDGFLGEVAAVAASEFASPLGPD